MKTSVHSTDLGKFLCPDRTRFCSRTSRNVTFLWLKILNRHPNWESCGLQPVLDSENQQYGVLLEFELWYEKVVSFG